jgi:hypothetical protein
MLTFRGNRNDEACPYLPRLLPEGVTRLGVGHTPGYSVKFKCDGVFSTGFEFRAVLSQFGQ